MKIIRFLTSVLIAALPLTGANALSLGLYATGSAGDSDWSYPDYFYNGAGLLYINSIQLNRHSRGLINAGGGGVILDTGGIVSGLMRYRLNIGFDGVWAGGPPEKKLVRLDIINTIGFNLYGSDDFNAWIGPQVMVNYAWGRDLAFNYEIKTAMTATGVPGLTVPNRYRRNYRLGGLNAGVAGGIQYRISGPLFFSAETGFRGCMYLYAGKMRSVYVLVKQFYYYGSPAGSYNGYEGYVSVGVLYGIRK